MTSDKEALQKIFEAALKQADPTPQKRPTQAFPKTTASAQPAPSASTTTASPPKQTEIPSEPIKKPAHSQPVVDATTADEVGALLDAKLKAANLKRKRQRLVTLVVLIGAIGGAATWVIQSPERIHSLQSAGTEIKSATDIKAIVGSYQKSVDKVAARSQQIDQAMEAMGVKKDAKDDADPYMEQEMKSMMGGEGKTIGERNRGMKAAFGNKAEANGGTAKPAPKLSKEDSFDIGN